MPRFPRRTFLAAAAASGTSLALAGEERPPDREPSEHLRKVDIEVGDATDVVRQARLYVPNHHRPTRLLILLHGLGETRSSQLGLEAWGRLYGLVRADERLRQPPVSALADGPRAEPERFDRINRELQQRPYQGMAVVCPVTPNPARHGDRSKLFDRYGAWLFDSLIPHVRQLVPSVSTHVGLDGCSMGGYVATELLLRNAQRLRSFGTVQSAVGVARVSGYVERLQRMPASSRPAIHIETSSADPFREVNQRLSKELTRAGVEHDFDSLLGPHDQPWLRQLGTLEMLLWHDRHL